MAETEKTGVSFGHYLLTGYGCFKGDVQGYLEAVIGGEAILPEVSRETRRGRKGRPPLD